MNKKDRAIVASFLIDSEKGLRTAQIAMAIAIKAKNSGYKISCELAYDTALIMNMGQLPISYIYEKDFDWSKHPEARNLNRKHGEESVKIAEQLGIELSSEQIDAIVAHCKGECPNLLCEIITIAETCEAVTHTRVYNNRFKKPAKDWAEIEAILRENKSLSYEMISIAKEALS